MARGIDLTNFLTPAQEVFLASGERHVALYDEHVHPEANPELWDERAHAITLSMHTLMGELLVHHAIYREEGITAPVNREQLAANMPFTAVWGFTSDIRFASYGKSIGLMTGYLEAHDKPEAELGYMLGHSLAERRAQHIAAMWGIATFWANRKFPGEKTILERADDVYERGLVRPVRFKPGDIKRLTGLQDQIVKFADAHPVKPTIETTRLSSINKARIAQRVGKLSSAVDSDDAATFLNHMRDESEALAAPHLSDDEIAFMLRLGHKQLRFVADAAVFSEDIATDPRTLQLAFLGKRFGEASVLQFRRDFNNYVKRVASYEQTHHFED